MDPRIYLGLAGALALLAACGPSKPTTDDGADADEQDADGDESGNGDGGDETGVPMAMCTLENYANDPQLLAFAEVGCMPAAGDGSCPVCDLACMESIVYDCPLDGCGLPDIPCFDECFDHLVLCSEQIGDQCCYLVTAEGSGAVPGRPLRERGVPRLPELTLLGSASQDPVAARYREFARYEQASVAAFAYAAALLEQLGAPSELVDGHRIAAREEAGHARLALAAAQALDGHGATLGELAPVELAVDLEQFVRDLIHDGCIGELVAAREAAWALAQPSVREREPLLRYWRSVVVEETGHAHLAWRTLEWLLAVRPELAPMITLELAAAMRSTERSEDTLGDALGLASADTRMTLRERAIAELLSSAHEVAAMAA